MRINKNENVRPFDVDKTLIIPIDPKNPVPGRKVDVWDTITGNYIKMIAHEPMVRLLIEEFHRGSHVIVWSRGGFDWATAVIQALDLVPFVHDVYSKPTIYFDDVPVEKWLTDRVYLEPDMIYKR